MRKILYYLIILFCINCVNIRGQQTQYVGTNDDSKPLGWGTKLYFAGNALNSDDMWISKYNVAHDQTDLRVNIADERSSKDRFVVGGRYYADDVWYERLIVTASGSVGIGVSYPTQALEVNGTIRAKEVKIESIRWADFVFSPDYKLRPLSEVKRHIEEKQHLPDIPSASDVRENGVDIGEMQVKLLQKIEELTLYTIQLEKRIKQLEDK